MFKILIFIFYIIKTIYSDSEEINEKYIDLLPEAEKQEFLNRIARRILEGIQSDDVPNASHVDITDDQLDQHHAYVQDIINQESENLRNKESKETGRNSDNNYAESSSSGGKREKRKNNENVNIETTAEPMYNVIPVKTIYEDYDAISKPNINNSSLTIEKHEDIKTVEEIKSHDYNIQENQESESVNTANVESLNTKSSQLNKDELSDIKTTDIKKFGLQSNENTTSDNADSEITTISTSKHANSTFNDEIVINEKSTQTINPSVDRETSKEEKNLNDTVLTTEKSVTVDTSDSERGQTEIITKDESTVLTTEKSIISTNKRSGKTIFHRSGTDLAQKINYTKVEEILQNSSSVIGPNTNETTPRGLSNDSVSYIVTTTQNILENNFNDKNSDENNEFKTNLRGTVSNEDDGKIPRIDIVMSPKKEYTVYEVAPGQTPFIISKNLTARNLNEPTQQDYVPIFNYAPENAYFKPNIRYGPTTSDREIQEYTQIPNNNKPELSPTNRFFGHNKKYAFEPNANHENEQLYPYYNILKPKKVKTTSIFYNPYDYMDMEYDVGRFKSSNMRNIRNFDGFPSSDEEIHPVNSIHKSETVKDHIRAVRNLMYLQKIFGPLSEVQRKFDQRGSKFNTNVRPVQVKAPIPKNIAIDYYFERMPLDEDYSDMLDMSQRSKPNSEKSEETKFKTKSDYIINYKDGINREKFKEFFNSLVTVLKDIIRFDNVALKQYKWLETAVDLQVVIRKFLDILDRIKQGDDVDKKHLELFKYGLYLFKISKTEIEDSDKEEYINKEEDKNLEEDRNREEVKFFIKGDREERSVLPHNKRKRKIKRPLQLLKDFVFYLRSEDEKKVANKLSIFYEYEDFLDNLLVNLYNLHEAIKNLATITTFKTQNWFVDLKRIYLNKASRREIGEIILHLSLINLLYKIENSRSIIEEDYKKFIRNHKKDVQMAKEDFVFVLLVLEELSKM